MFMRVVSPAPFSPSSAWISPGLTVRSTRSFAKTPGNRLVTPLSSSFTSAPGRAREGGRAPARPPPRCRSCRRVVGRVDRDRPVDDALLQLFDLGLQRIWDLALPVVVGR